MARNVFPSSEVAHIWRNRGQDNGRNANSTFYFTGGNLYSYGSHFVIAAWVENNVLLWNESNYSPTTQRHQSHAYRAFNWKLPANTIRVPSLNDDKLRDLRTCRELCKDSKRLPVLVTECADIVIDAMQNIVEKRADSTRQIQFDKAVGAQNVALQLLAYVAHKGYAPKYPLPMLPASMPTDKAGIAELSKTMARGRLISSYAEWLARAEIALDKLVGYLAAPVSWQDQNLNSHIRTIADAVQKAGKFYETAYGKKSAAVSKFNKAALPVFEKAIVRADAYELDCNKDRVLQAAKQFFSYAHASKSQDAHKPNTVTAHKLASIRRVNGFNGNTHFNEAIQSLKKQAPEFLAQFPLARMARYAEWMDAQDILDRAMSDMETARSYDDIGNSSSSINAADAKHWFNRAVREFGRLDALPKFRSLNAKAIDEARKAALHRLATIDAEIAAQYAQSIEDWKAGKSARTALPYSAGTYARIDRAGTSVETSRGASVPIEHACRLARLARVAMRKGGIENASINVGHYTVTRIGPDCSLTIGCHEFDSAEGMRLLAMLETCEACSAVTVEAI